MPRLSYQHLDVFTRTPFGGSRLSLFPDAGGVPRRLMQKIAREMGGSETAFVTGAGPDGAMVLRSFTATGEIPLSGISLLGATCGLERLGRLRAGTDGARFRWRTETGCYPVTVTRRDGVPFYAVEYPPAEILGATFQRERVARALGLPQREIVITGLPCEIVSGGLPVHIVPVGSLEAVRTIRPDREAVAALRRDLGFGDLFVFTCETESPEADVHCRMFAPGFGLPEDPATGSAVVALLAYMVRHGLVGGDGTVRIVCEQGLEMGRPSLLYAEAPLRGDVAGPTSVGGHCVLVGEGWLETVTLGEVPGEDTDATSPPCP